MPFPFPFPAGTLAVGAGGANKPRGGNEELVHPVDPLASSCEADVAEAQAELEVDCGSWLLVEDTEFGVTAADRRECLSKDSMSILSRWKMMSLSPARWPFRFFFCSHRLRLLGTSLIYLSSLPASTAW